MARKKRQADPYAEQSTEVEDEGNLDIDDSTSGDKKLFDNTKTDIRICPHANRSVNFNYVRKYLKNSVPIGSCVHCTKAKVFAEIPEDNNYVPVVWLCAFCGYQGCDRNSSGKHAFTHYKTPRSDPHCIIINTQLWTVWCYECNTEVVHTSSKKLHEVIQHSKRMSEMAPKRTFSSNPNFLLNPTTTNLVTQYSGSDSRLNSRKSYDEMTKRVKSRNFMNNKLATLPKVKGINNLGNTCFFNSVFQNLSESHLLLDILDMHLKSGQRVTLPAPNRTVEEPSSPTENCSVTEADLLEMKPLDLYLTEGGPLSLSLNMLLKDMHSADKGNVVNPGHLFGQICKKSTQFQGYQQQDAHELLRCLLDAIRTEEVQRMKRAILRAFGLSEKTDPNAVNCHLRSVIKTYGMQALHTIVDQIFGGQLISTVFCEECHWSSQVFEPFMDLSLPVTEEKGKPRRGGSSENINNAHDADNSKSGSASKEFSNRKKKRSKDKRKRNKRELSDNNDPEPNNPNSCPPKITSEDCSSPSSTKNSMSRDEERAKRLTEARRPEDEEEYRQRAAAAELANQSPSRSPRSDKSRNSESVRARRLMESRREADRMNRRDSEAEESLEADYDEDEDILGCGPAAIHKHVTWTEDWIMNSQPGPRNHPVSNVRSVANDKSSKSFRETSDADVEDNVDSETFRENDYPDTRHPSIVVEESSTDPIADSEPIEIDSKLLSTSQSLDHLNYSSDCSERYFTAAGVDTMDELDYIPHDSYSHRTNATNTSGKGDSLSISSGEFLGYRNDDVHAYSTHPKDDHMEEACIKVSALQIRRKSSSRESLLESGQASRRGSGNSQGFPGLDPDQTVRNAAFWTRSLSRQKLKQEWIARSLTTLAPRYQCGRQECSIMSCLNNFTSPELMTGNNKITCDNCTRLHNYDNTESPEPVKRSASKQLLVFSPPAILTLHLKRFHHVGHTLAKVNRHVQFPLVLDIASFTSDVSHVLGNMSAKQTQVLYTLYGIVEHSGRLNSGHYVAYVRSRPLDVTKPPRHLLNLKPWNQFEIDRLVSDLAEESDQPPETKSSSSSSQSWRGVDVKVLEEEVRVGRWFHVSDTYVAEVNIEKVLKAQAYLLFYERIV